MDTTTKPRLLPANPMIAGLPPGEATTDRIAWVKLSSVTLPLHAPISDAKVLTGRQKPMTQVVFLFCEIETQQGQSGIGGQHTIGKPHRNIPQHHRDCRGKNPLQYSLILHKESCSIHNIK